MTNVRPVGRTSTNSVTAHSSTFSLMEAMDP